MAWTAPRTWTPHETLTAALLNAQIRDNMLETEAAKATGDGGFFITTALNTIAERHFDQTEDTSTGTTTSTVYTDTLTSGGTGPAVTVTTDVLALVLFSANYQNSGLGQTYVSFRISGATTTTSSDSYALVNEEATNYPNQHMRHAFIDVAAGSNTFTMQYKVESGTGTFSMRRIFVFPI